jgi:hypothetical protein
MDFASIEANAIATADAITQRSTSYSYGGGVWVHDARDPTPGGVWRVYRLQWAVDPVAIDILDPAKVDRLRTEAASLLDAFPDTLLRLRQLGCEHTDLVHTPIASSEDVAAWAYSIFNAATPAQPTVPLGKYPFRVASTAALAPDGFEVVHPDIEGHVAVLPADDKRTRVYWSSPGTSYDVRIGQLLGPRHPVSRSAWAGQPCSATAASEEVA